MALAVSLIFDDDIDKAVRQIWQMLAAEGVCDVMQGLGYPPHVSLLVSDDDAIEADLRGMMAALSQIRAMDLMLGPVRHFPDTSIVWLNCDGGAALMDLHRHLADRAPAGAIRPHYQPGQWTPHVTLQMTGDRVRGEALASSAWSLPRRGRAVRLELARFMPVVPLAGIALS